MTRIKSSFRDPDGFVFKKDDIIYRSIAPSYKKHYDHLINSGLYKALVSKKYLVSHQEVDSYKLIQPEVIPFISYPYEWSWGQLKDAARLTLEIQKVALTHGMSLKDASAYNIQFLNGRPILIDTLSFEIYTPGKPWVAYRQFCEQFLAPLVLITKKDLRLNQLFKSFLDGIPLDMASKLLPVSTYLSMGILMHIHLHAKAQSHFSEKTVKKNTLPSCDRNALMGLIESLENTVQKLTLPHVKTEWGEYYQNTNYSSAAFHHKKQIVTEYLEDIKPDAVWDIGANCGTFSRISAQKKIPTVAFDKDPLAVENNYKLIKKEDERYLLPLIQDVLNPTPSLGWHNQERLSLSERGPVHTIFALALIHHLAISHNLPLDYIADFLSTQCRYLIIEFVPKQDSNVQKLLAYRKDIFENYTADDFEATFSNYFMLQKKQKIVESERAIYLFSKREDEK